VADLVASFLGDKRASNVGTDFIMALRSQLARLESFLAGRSKFYASDITRQDVADFRATWSESWNPLKRSRVQTNIRSFLRFAGRHDLLDCFSRIKTLPSKPNPLSEDQVKNLLALSSPRIALFIRTAVSIGAACIDVVSLERAAVAASNHVLRYNRKKTGRTATPRIDARLREELLSSGEGKYIFWDGRGLLDSAVREWQGEVRELFKAAGIYVKGDLTHRFRDTAVDFWFSAGCTSSEVADMCGDTTSIIERHYKDYCSRGRENHIATLPARQWDGEDAALETIEEMAKKPAETIQ
jgi:hypothetical protein